MRKAIFSIVLLIPSSILIGNTIANTLPTVQLIPAVTVSSEKCFEDMPCWDCTTMGNKICGTSVTPSELEAELSESKFFNGTTELPRTS